MPNEPTKRSMGSNSSFALTTFGLSSEGRAHWPSTSLVKPPFVRCHAILSSKVPFAYVKSRASPTFKHLCNRHLLGRQALLLIRWLALIKITVVQARGSPLSISADIREIIGAMPDGVGVNSNLCVSDNDLSSTWHATGRYPRLSRTV